MELIRSCHLIFSKLLLENLKVYENFLVTYTRWYQNVSKIFSTFVWSFHNFLVKSYVDIRLQNFLGYKNFLRFSKILFIFFSTFFQYSSKLFIILHDHPLLFLKNVFLKAVAQYQQLRHYNVNGWVRPPFCSLFDKNYLFTYKKFIICIWCVLNKILIIITQKFLGISFEFVSIFKNGAN